MQKVLRPANVHQNLVEGYGEKSLDKRGKEVLQNGLEATNRQKATRKNQPY